jgi:putative DNA primase/helicase
MWTELAFSQLLNDVVNYLHKLCNEQIKLLRIQMTNDDDYEEINNKKIKQLEKEKLNIAKANHGKAIIEFITHFFYCDDFMNKLDVSEHILPIKNGKVIDLKTLKVRDRISKDYFTYEIDVNYTSDTPKAKRFFSQLMSDDEARTKVLQAMLGYSITGNIDAKAYFVLIGCGDNGKSALMRVIQTIFKPLFVAIQKSLLFSENRMKQDMMPYLAVLAGKRFGVYNEPSDSLEMNESMVKAITGGDEIVAKKLYRDPFTFTPVVKMWILTNKIIKFDACSEPMVKRTKLISMDAQFVDKPTKKGQYKKDPDFVRDLETIYKDEVFSFIAQGAFEYYKNKSFGDDKCEKIVKYKNDYMESIDAVHSFVKRKCVVDTTVKITTTDLFDSFIEYCDKHGETMIGRKKFYDGLRCKKIISFKSNGTWYYNIRLVNYSAKDDEDEEHMIGDAKDESDEESSGDDDSDVDPQLCLIYQLRGKITHRMSKLKDIALYNEEAKTPRETESIIDEIKNLKEEIAAIVSERKQKRLSVFKRLNDDFKMLMVKHNEKRKERKEPRACAITLEAQALPINGNSKNYNETKCNIPDVSDDSDDDDSDSADSKYSDDSEIEQDSDGEDYSFFQ